MSFSGDVKDELSRQLSTARHCLIAEAAAIISCCGRVIISSDDRYSIKIHTENIAVARKYFTLLKKTFNINTEISIKQNTYLKKSRVYTVAVTEDSDARRVLSAIKLLDKNQQLTEGAFVDPIVIQRSCCKRAFIRGAFLASGSISDPNKFYHLEIVCLSEHGAEKIQEAIQSFDIDAKIVVRKKYFVVYVKESSQIVELLNVMEAHVALMNLENIRILKEMRNTVNRKVNCETANINKTVSAAVKQIEDIKHIQAVKGLDTLPDSLREIARLRLEYPEATLKELGMLLTPQVGKSGVNHRLRKLSDLAEQLRN